MAQLSHDRLEPMFRDRSLNRAEIATDLAIPLLAEHGWSGLTLAAVAARGNMRRQSLTQWFGSGEAFREQVAWRYAHRWTRLLSAQLTGLRHEEDPDAAAVARMLLPRDEDGIAFARVWLAICEAGRSDPSIAASSTFGENEEQAMIATWWPDAKSEEIRTVSALVTGLRAQLCAAEPISLTDALAVVTAAVGQGARRAVGG